MKLTSNKIGAQQIIGLNSAIPKQHIFEQFDFLRAIFAIAIIAYKTNIFYIPEILIPNSFTYALSAYILSGMVGALAVPVFLQISLFLFYLKSGNTGFRYFIQRRLPRLIGLYAFWVGSITLYEILLGEGWKPLREGTSSLKMFAYFIVSGNSTPYFFFFSLIFVTVLAEILVLLFERLKNTSAKSNLSYCLLFASCILVFTFSTIDPIIKHTGIQSSLLDFINNLTRWDYTPFNFLPYVFTTAITVQQYNEGKLTKFTKSLKLKLYCLLFLTIMFVTLEWTWTDKQLLIQVDQGPLDHYMRLSLVFGSWLLLYLALLSKQAVPEIVKFISKCSLGIYGFHVFFTFRKLLNFDSIIFLNNLFKAVPVLEVLAIFLTTLIGSIALTLLCKKSKLLNNFV